MVFSRNGGPPGGHVALVRSIISGRQIRVDHANWLGHGRIYVNDPVVDVSAANDWSAVRVWNAETSGWGIRTYPVSGFVGPAASPLASAPPRQLRKPCYDNDLCQFLRHSATPLFCLGQRQE